MKRAFISGIISVLELAFESILCHDWNSDGELKEYGYYSEAQKTSIIMPMAIHSFNVAVVHGKGERGGF